LKEAKPKIPDDAPIGTIWCGGPIEWDSITLRICGDNLIPSTITKIMGIEPNLSHKKNETIYDKDGNIVRRARTGQWHLEYKKSMTDEWDCNYAIIDFMKTIKISDLEWKKITKEYMVDLFVCLYMKENRNKGFQLEPELMCSLGEKGISLGFDIYYN
jgi:hypothetical protein